MKRPGMRRFSAVLLAILGLLTVALPASAQEDQLGPTTLVVHEVDARQDTTTMALIADAYEFEQEGVQLKQNGSTIDPSLVTTARLGNSAQELVFVVDANSSLSSGDVFKTVISELSTQITRLPLNTTVSVVSAGVAATVVVKPTTNLPVAAERVRNMRQSGSTSLFEGIRIAGGLLSSDLDTFKTVVVFSGVPDPAVSVDPLVAAQPLIAKRAQLVAFRYQSGDDRLSTIIRSAGGITVGTSESDAVASSVRDAVTAASNRLIIEFEGPLTAAQRGDGTLVIGNAQVGFSYPGGRLSTSVAGLAAREVVSGSGISFLQNSMVLYIALAIAAIGIGLLVYTLASTFSGGETTLDNLMKRYSGEGDGVLSEEESAIVQTALVRRAVEMSESFAEDRGFLAKVEGLLERARLPLRPGEAMSIYASAIVFGGAIGYLLLGGLIGGLVLAGIVAFGQISAIQFVAKRRIKQFEAQLPDTLQLLASTLKAGYSLPQGIEAVSKEISDPMGFELGRAMTEARLGRELEEALSGIAERLESEDFAWVVMAIGIQREVGGNLNELLMTVSDTMIARERLKGEVAALTAEGKISAIMIGGMSPVLGVIMWVMNKEYMNQLLMTGLGNILLGVALVTSLIGFVWMKKVITVHV